MSGEEDQAAMVAADYRDYLEGLTMNSRVEISTLTSIARENTENAHVISEVLQDHIKQVAAPRKLPALYLLDSIVKNVGTPYTLFFGRKLYSTFMEAYASVDNNTRRKMDEMLKTWKEPVPGSLDTRPVFPPDVVRPIENALIKARTSALQAQQEQMRTQQQLLGGRGMMRPGGRAPPYRDTPTPPGTARPVANPPVGGGPPYGLGPNNRVPEGAPPAPPGYPPVHPLVRAVLHAAPWPRPQAMLTNPSTSSAPLPQQPPSAPAALPYAPPPQLQQPQPGGISAEALSSDVAQLIVATKAENAQNPYDSVVQTRLQALQDLQTILQAGNLPQDQLVLVRNQVDEMSVKMRGSAPPRTAPVTSGISLSHPSTHPPQPQLPLQPALVAPPVATPVAPPASAPLGPISLNGLIGSGALDAVAALLRAHQSVTPQAAASNPRVPPPFPPTTAASAAAIIAGLNIPSITLPVATALRSPPPPPVAPASATSVIPSEASSLIASLRMKGLLPPAPPTTNPSIPLPMHAPTPVSLSQLVPGVISPTASAAAAAAAQGVTGVVSAGDIALTSRSLKQPRLYLIATLHEDLGPPCTQCGRRFRTDAAGKKAKTAHMDWHFRVHQRIAEAEKKGQHRSFYVDKPDWVASREVVDDDAHHASSKLPASSASTASDRELWPSVGGSSVHHRAAGGGVGDGGAGGVGGAASGGGAGPRGRWIPVPDSGTTNTICPICQEKFEMTWLEEAQEWVWMDAVRVGGGDRVYHASCHAEVSGGGGTPEPVSVPVLGKRKAEDELASMRGKLKMDPGRFKYDELPY